MSKTIAHLKEKTAKTKRAVEDQTLAYMTSALSVVAGLAWNEAIRDTIDSVFPASDSGLAAKFVYAVVMTVAVVILTLVLRKILGTKQEEDEEAEEKTDKK